MVTEIYNEFPQESINSLVLSFPTRLHMVIKENGGSISDLIRSGIHDSSNYPLVQNKELIKHIDHYIIQMDSSVDDTYEIDVLPWSIDEEVILLKKIHDIGKKCHIISQYIPGRSPTEIKNYYQRKHGKLVINN